MKRKQPPLRFELGSPILFPSMISVALSTQEQCLFVGVEGKNKETRPDNYCGSMV